MPGQSLGARFDHELVWEEGSGPRWRDAVALIVKGSEGRVREQGGLLTRVLCF